MRPAGLRRRDVLYGLAAAGVCLAAGTTAQAFTAQSSSDYGAMLDNACGASLDHKRQIATIERTLGMPLSDDRLVKLLQRTTCPACGCPLMPPGTASAAF
ncbi:hypothetical protein TSO352_04470 [Azospirillum sp. TSO35-2]|nr:hypothetical protein TSO352_04470 [Azospirillum sp. TSO35-2]